MRETRKVTTKNVIYAITRDLDRDIRDPKTEHYSLSLLYKALIMAKRFVYEEFAANDDSIPAPIELQTGYLLAVMRSTIAIEATNFGYTLQNVEQAHAWLVAWKVAYQLDIDR